MAEVITFKCTNCQHVLKVGTEKAGRKAKCPKCDQTLTVPSSTGAELPVQKKESEEEVEAYGLADEPAHVAPKVDLSAPIRPGEEDDDDEDRPAIHGVGPKAQKREKAIKKRTLLEPERWQPVKLGLKIMAAGFGVWIFTLVLHLLPFAITSCQVIFPPLFGDEGNQLKPQYALIAQRYETYQNEPQSPEHLNKAAFAVGCTTGVDLLDAGLWIFRIEEVFVLLMIITCLVGYSIALSVPNRFGAKGILIALLAVGGFNLIFHLVFKLLPLTGVMDFTLLMYVTPELAIIDGNIERITPLPAFWSYSPFWEILFALILTLLSFTEPLLFAAIPPHHRPVDEGRPLGGYDQEHDAAGGVGGLHPNCLLPAGLQRHLRGDRERASRGVHFGKGVFAGSANLVHDRGLPHSRSHRQGTRLNGAVGSTAPFATPAPPG